MSQVYAEIACHTPQKGMYAVRLHGGPWDGKVVGVRVANPPLVQVNGPRHGQHSVWITHLYKRCGDRYEFVATEVFGVSAWRITLDSDAVQPGRGAPAAEREDSASGQITRRPDDPPD